MSHVLKPNSGYTNVVPSRINAIVHFQNMSMKMAGIDVKETYCVFVLTLKSNASVAA